MVYWLMGSGDHNPRVLISGGVSLDAGSVASLRCVVEGPRKKVDKETIKVYTRAVL